LSTHFRRRAKETIRKIKEHKGFPETENQTTQGIPRHGGNRAARLALARVFMYNGNETSDTVAVNKTELS
jgi:hypothetical protein